MRVHSYLHTPGVSRPPHARCFWSCWCQTLGPRGRGLQPARSQTLGSRLGCAGGSWNQGPGESFPARGPSCHHLGRSILPLPEAWSPRALLHPGCRGLAPCTVPVPPACQGHWLSLWGKRLLGRRGRFAVPVWLFSSPPPHSHAQPQPPNLVALLRTGTSLHPGLPPVSDGAEKGALL